MPKRGDCPRARPSLKRRFSEQPADFRRFTPSSGKSSIWRAQVFAENRRFYAHSSGKIFARGWRKIRQKFFSIFCFADFCPSIARENGHKKSHKKSSTFSKVRQIKFFHCISGNWGAQQVVVEYCRKLQIGSVSGQTPQA